MKVGLHQRPALNPLLLVTVVTMCRSPYLDGRQRRQFSQEYCKMELGAEAKSLNTNSVKT